jgi:hypothetical protein
MDIKSEHVAEAKRLSPETEIIFRKEDGKKWRDKDPVEWARAMWADVHECPPDWVVPDNEPLGHAAVNEFAAFDQWQRAFADWVHANTPMKVGMFGFPEGNFTKDGPNIAECFPLSMEVADAVFIHEYWKPHLDSEGMEHYHCLRWDAWLQWFEDAGYPDMPIYVTEVGITMAVNALPHGEPSGPDVGYASDEAKAAGVTEETYMADLEEYHRRCCLEPRVKAILPFIWRPWPGEWGSFVPTEAMTQKMFLFDAPGPSPGPEPEPPGGSEMDLTKIKVFKLKDDYSGHIECTTLADKEALVFGKYGAEFRLAEVASGQKVYRLSEIWEKTGHSSLITQVLNEDGSPMANADVAFYWPGAPEEQAANDNDWYKNFVHGPTNKDGDVGPGMGTGAYHGEGEGGPHATWVRDPSVPSDIFEKLGMLAGTNHDHLDHKFKRETASEGPGPGPSPSPGAASRIAAILRECADELEALDALAETLADRL